MCGRATLTATPEQIRDAFGLEVVPPLTPRYNIAPSQRLHVRAAFSPRALVPVRWGFHPGGDPKATSLINARGETVRSSRAFAHAFEAHRCLVCVDGFYEWQRLSEPATPFLVRRDDRAPFALAGILEHDKDGQLGCAILTAPSVGVVAKLHDRMPVIVPREGHHEFVFGSTDAASRWVASNDAHLVAVAVSTWVNDPRHNDARCIEPREPRGQLELF